MKVHRRTEFLMEIDGDFYSVEDEPLDYFEPFVQQVSPTNREVTYAVGDEFQQVEFEWDYYPDVKVWLHDKRAPSPHQREEVDASEHTFLVIRHSHGLDSYSALPEGGLRQGWDDSLVGKIGAPDLDTANAVLERYSAWTNGETYQIWTSLYSWNPEDKTWVYQGDVGYMKPAIGSEEAEALIAEGGVD